MSIALELQAKIEELANGYWSRHVDNSTFAEIIRGKEPGHRMADYVDDKTTALLKVELETRYEGNPHGDIKKRSMGDIWVRSHGIYNPINVKSGLLDMRGQPNVVSMRKLLDYLLKRRIDSYYLLIVKFDTTSRNRITHSTYFFDLLEWLDFVTFDAGPGQIMLKEHDFYGAYDAQVARQDRPIVEKVATLFNLFERQVEALISNRTKSLDRKRAELARFEDSPFVVDQAEMSFIP